MYFNVPNAEYIASLYPEDFSDVHGCFLYLCNIKKIDAWEFGNMSWNVSLISCHSSAPINAYLPKNKEVEGLPSSTGSGRRVIFFHVTEMKRLDGWTDTYQQM